MKELNRICSSFVNMIRYDPLERPQSMMEREAEDNKTEALKYGMISINSGLISSEITPFGGETVKIRA